MRGEFAALLSELVFGSEELEKKLVMSVWEGLFRLGARG
jgi:hypothetical protein